MTSSAVVFAYHDVGVRCLRVLLDAGIDVALVVTHDDDPGEARWFASVADEARIYGLRCASPADANSPDVIDRLQGDVPRPRFLFSFYYRRMLGPAWLGWPRDGAYNVHGSLLPRYRGRAPVNWAVLNGERKTGATLHEMTARPDAGRIVDRFAVPILGDDNAREVMAKVTIAAEMVLARSLPRLVDGTATPIEQKLSSGGYYGGRGPEDGRIPIDAGARQVHDLVRAVAPPYPGAFFDTDAGPRIHVERTRLSAATADARRGGLRLQATGGRLWLRCFDGGLVQVVAARADGSLLDAATFAARFPKGLEATDTPCSKS